jgi:PAS domain S-box-containing protein
LKTPESIRLSLATTVSVGLLSSLMLVLFFSTENIRFSENSHLYKSLIMSAPILIASIAAYLQLNYIMKPWYKALGELVQKALNLQGNRIDANADKDQLSLLRSSIETATQQFKDVQERERMLIQYAADVICVIDLQSTILSVNPASRTVWGYNPEELVGKQITDYLLSNDVKNTMKALLKAEKSIEKIVFENRFRKKNGDVVDLLWSAHLSATDRGLFCIAHDITERKKAEQMLKESEERVRRILEGLPAGVAVVGQSGRIDFMNLFALELTGYNQEEIHALSASTIFNFLQADGSLALDSVSDPAGAGFDCRISKSSGASFPAEASIRSISWGNEQVSLVIFLDATMKHELETAKREFVAMVSHDLKTPLTTISLIFAYLQDGLGGTLSDDGVEFAKKGQESCERLMILVQDLLDLEKMRAGKFVMDYADTDVKEILSASVSAVEPYASSQGILISLNCPADIKCFCDGARIIQVMINLLGNAIKFSQADGTVCVDVEDSEQTVTVGVSNRGKTIPPEKLLSIFEKFEQANARGAEERKGTGLGLTISKTIVEQHKGRIWVESSDEKGTRFSFSLPKHESE